MQEEKPGKPMMTLVSKTAGQFPIALGSSASYSPETLKAQSSKFGRRPVVRGMNENTASSSQVWDSDVNRKTSTGRLVAETKKKPIGTKLSHHNFEDIQELCWSS